MKLQRNTSLNKCKYIIISCIGQGGFGITYKARQQEDNKIVCVKEFFVKSICSRNNSDSGVLVVGDLDNFNQHKKLFIKEAKTLINITHPNIIRVLDVFEENNTAYYVMEFAEGESLAARIPSHGILESEALNIMSQLCNAVSFLHKKNITHLDIKPENILVSKSGHITLIDFGASKRYSEWGEETSTSPTAASEGFAPIELYQDKALSHISPETDIYEIGATLYNMVSGKTPPSAWNLLEERLALSQLNISPSVARAIDSAMRPRRQERCHNVDSFWDILVGNSTTDDETQIDDNDITVIDDSTVKNNNALNDTKFDNATVTIEVATDNILNNKKKHGNKGFYFVVIICFLIVIGLSCGWYLSKSNDESLELVETNDTIEMVEEELSQYVKSANNLNSFAEQSIIRIDSLSFYNKKLTFYITITEEGNTVFDELKTSDKVRKDYVIAGLRGDKKLFEKCQQLIQIDGTLCYHYRFGNESIEIALNSSELSAIDPYVGSEESIKIQKYTTMAQNISNQCPSEVDEGIIMTSCKFENSEIVYSYDCTSEAYAIISTNLDDYKSEMAQEFTNNNAIKMFVDVARKDNVSIVYVYKNTNNNSIIKLIYNTQLKKFI